MTTENKTFEKPLTLRDHYDQLLKNEPKLIENYVPTDATQQREAFFRGDIRNPDHTYGKLDSINFDENMSGINQVGSAIIDIFSEDLNLNDKHLPAYNAFIENYKAKTHLMHLAHDYKHAIDREEKNRLRHEYMQLNIELYGKPDEATYRSLLEEKLSKISAREYSPRGQQLREELFALVNYDDSTEKIERFRPSKETVEWMHSVAESLYGGMLSHVPTQEVFTPKETKTIFEAIIREEFSEAAEGWTVDIEGAKSINVKSAEKRIIIPEDRGNLTYQDVRRLVVHELGVHVLRAITGGETNLDPLRQGLNGYYDAEEGLGVVMEQALMGKFKEAGIPAYITAGLAYCDGLDFRDTYEVKWHLSVLEAAKDGRVIGELDIAKAKKTAYGSVVRSFRGTDELPWFKDLAYYNGAIEMWKHLEKIKGDDIKFMFILMGKADPANINHERIMYETASI